MQRTHPGTEALATTTETILDRWALALTGLTFALWSIVLTIKYYSLGYQDWDLALSSQTLWTINHGSMTPSLLGMSFLANHAEYIAFLVAPIYKLLPHPLTLLHLKILSYMTGGLLLYRLARSLLTPGLAILVLALFFLHPANIFSLLHEFHFESLSIGLLLGMFYFYHHKKLVPFLITGIVASLIKENMPPVIVTFGIFALFARDRDRRFWAALPILYGLLAAYLSLFIILPAFRRGLYSPNQFLYIYSGFGRTPAEILLNALLKPSQILQTVLLPKNLQFINDVFGPLGYLSFLSPQILFLILPVLLQILLSSEGANFHNILYHYPATVVPFVFLAFIFSLRTLRERLDSWLFRTLIAGLCLMSLVWVPANILRAVAQTRSYDRTDIYKRWAMIRQVPPDGGILTTFGYDDPLSNRGQLYSILNVVQGTAGLSGRPWVLPPEVRYCLLDMEDGWIKTKIFQGGEGFRDRIRNFFSAYPWDIRAALGDHFLLERSSAAGFPLSDLVRRSFTPMLSQAPSVTFTIGYSVQLLRIEQLPELWPDRVRLRFWWRSLRDQQRTFGMRLRYRNDHGREVSQARRIGYMLNPTKTWKKDEYIVEDYWLPVNDLKGGERSLDLSFADIDSGAALPVTATSPQMQDGPKSFSETIIRHRIFIEQPL